MKSWPVILLLCGALLSGCATDLKVAKFEPANAAGIAYSLPFTQFSVTTKWTITSCSPNMEVTAKVDATSNVAEDGEHSYLIDPASIQTATNVASLKVTYQPGTNIIDTINADVEDQTGTVITNVVTGVAKIALTAVGAVPDPHATFVPPVCSADTVKAFDKVKALSAQLKALTARVTDQTEIVKTLGAKVIQMGAAVDDETKDKLGKAIDVLNDLTSQQTDLSGQLVDAQKAISYSVTDVWPKDSKTFAASPGAELPASVASKWTDQPVGQLQGSVVYFVIETTGTFGRDPANPSAAAEPPASVQGLRYWIPAQGRLVACDQSPCTSRDPAHLLVKVDGRISQLGYIAVLPVHTKPFGSNTFTATFDANGGLKSAGYEQKTAPAVGATAAFSSSASSLSPLIAALGPTASLNRQAGQLAAAKKVQDGLAALQTDPNSTTSLAAKALEADTALINARVANLQAQATLTALVAAQAK